MESLWAQPVPTFNPSHARRECFPTFKWNFSFFDLCPLPLVTGQSLAPSLPSHHILAHIAEIPPTFSSPGRTAPPLSASPTTGAPVPSAPWWPFTGPTPVSPCLSHPGGPSTGASAPDVASPAPSRGRICPLQQLARFSLVQPRALLTFHAALPAPSPRRPAGRVPFCTTPAPPQAWKSCPHTCKSDTSSESCAAGKGTCPQTLTAKSGQRIRPGIPARIPAQCHSCGTHTFG